MRWTPGGESDDIEDRRGESAGDDGAGGGPPGFSPGPFSRGGGIPIRMGLGGTVVVLLLSVFFGRDFLGLLGGGADVPGPPPAPRAGASRDQGQPGVGQGARRGRATA